VVGLLGSFVRLVGLLGFLRVVGFFILLVGVFFVYYLCTLVHLSFFNKI
jgi:hypothetical protein